MILHFLPIVGLYQPDSDHFIMTRKNAAVSPISSQVFFLLVAVISDYFYSNFWVLFQVSLPHKLFPVKVLHNNLQATFRGDFSFVLFGKLEGLEHVLLVDQFAQQTAGCVLQAGHRAHAAVGDELLERVEAEPRLQLEAVQELDQLGRGLGGQRQGERSLIFFNPVASQQLLEKV